MGKTSSPPPAPDPRVLTQTQGTMNSDTLRLLAQLNRPNQNSPFGSTSWTRSPTFDQDRYNRALSEWQGRGGKPEEKPEESAFWSDNYTQDQTFDPRITGSIFDELDNQDARSKMGSFMNRAISSQIMDPSNGWYKPFDPQLIPSGVDRVDPMGKVVSNVDLQGLPDLKTADFGNVPGLPGIGDFGAERNNVEDALYGRQTARLDPQFQKRQSALETQLENQGFARGSEGWKNAMDDFAREREQAYSGARNDSITGAGTEQGRLFGQALAARNQVTGEDTTLAQDARAARAQGTGERFQGAGFTNQATAQDMNQQVARGNFMNAARQQRFGEELTKRNQPFSEYSAFMGTGAPQIPSMGPVGQVGGVAPPDYMGAAMNQYGSQVGAYNQQQAGRNNTLNSGIGAAAKLASMFA